MLLDAENPLVISGVEGGVVVTDSRAHWAKSNALGELVAEPMPGGLPDGPGRAVSVAGRLSGPLWVVYEKQGADGGTEGNPLLRLGKDGFKAFADDWKPALAPWTKRRMLAASTSSGRLKIKVLEPATKTAPDDVPSVHLTDAACEKSLRIEALLTLPTGEVLATANCKPERATGEKGPPSRYVVIRWAPMGAPKHADVIADGGATDASADGGAEEHPATVEILPGNRGRLSHVALWARDGGDIWVAAQDNASRSPPAATVFHFDGTAWSPVEVPPTVTVVRGLVGVEGGSVWLASDRAVFRRGSSGGWESIPLPRGATAGETWELGELASPNGREVWIAAQRVTPSGTRHAVLATGPVTKALGW